MSDAVRVTHYKMIWDARMLGGVVFLRDEGGAQHEIATRDAATLAALVATLRSETNLVYESSSARLYSGDWRPVRVDGEGLSAPLRTRSRWVGLGSAKRFRCSIER